MSNKVRSGALAATVAFPALAFAGTAMTTPAQPAPQAVAAASSTASERILLGNFYHRENGCHSSSDTTVINIPNAANLDRAHPGTMAGIEVVLTANNHGSFTGHVDDNKVVISATATGPGHWVDNPVSDLLGGHGGGGWCMDAQGADIGGQVYGWFLRVAD
jgi:hypothetical protein